ncbi:MAG: hypothetical protein JWP81_2031 [Ferruginibacter sp.]|nr:hypothetical protein [Ferruginibacter sp.]
MGRKKSEKSIQPKDLPEGEVFGRKEIFQHPPPADSGKPLKDHNQNDLTRNKRTAKKTSNEPGLNESQSVGNAGAFEGFEDQGRE